MLTGTTLELNIADYGRANNIKINTLLFEKPEEAFAAAEAGRCDGYTDDGGSVAAARSAMKKPDDWVILPELISREFLGSLVRQGDERWSILVKWVHFAMLEAEVLGITKANVDEMKAKTTDPETRAFLGLEGEFGKLHGHRQRVGLPDRQGGRQLRRELRRLFRPQGARAAARVERALQERAGCNTRCPGGERVARPEWIRRGRRRASASRPLLPVGLPARGRSSAASCCASLASMLADNLARRNLSFGFGFLGARAGFDIPFHLISWSTFDTYARALLVSLLNTLLVAAMSVVTATLLGLLVGIMRLSVNWLLRNIALVFVEFVRNTPQLVQIIFWYVACCRRCRRRARASCCRAASCSMSAGSACRIW